MDKEQLQKLEKLGINTNQTTIDIFANLLDLCEFLYDEAGIREEDRFKIELHRLKKPSN